MARTDRASRLSLGRARPDRVVTRLGRAAGAVLAVAVAAGALAGSQVSRGGRPLDLQVDGGAAQPAPSMPGLVSAGPVPNTPIKHVVIFMKENRSFDEYFGKFPGVDGATTGQMSNGQTVALAPTPDPMPNDIVHQYKSFLDAYNGGAMNGFDLERGAFSTTGQNLAYTQMSESQIPNYWAYAKRYAIGDRFFASGKGPSFVNNLFSVAGQAGQFDPSLAGRTALNLPDSGFQPRLSPWGCDSPPDTLVPMLDMMSGAASESFPCFNFPPMPVVLEQHGISWNFFGGPGDTGFEHNALDAMSTVRNQPSMWAKVKPILQFQRDAAAGRLPAVSWIAAAQNEHPPASACAGENETVGFLNALMNGPDWSSTAVFIFWDEWGGFYDHVPPPQINPLSYGFRVPFLVISPWTKTGSSSDGGTVSSTLYSQPSILHFIETNWGLPSLTPATASANNVTDLFDFSAPSKDKLILSRRNCHSLSPAEQQLLQTRPSD
ncbi:MAG: hypothetical protein M3N98_09735 [Actinomycetota bacterium]|nr:hypothetical protein [Actinomycetota bacterium]